MAPVNVQLFTHTKGDTWPGMDIGPVTFDSGPPPADLDSCRMYFRDPSGGLVLKFSSSPGVGEETITIVDAVTWEITVPAVIIDLDVRNYSWDFETTDDDGTILTLYSGIWSITKEQSYG